MPRVLIVDDDDDTRVTMRAVLEDVEGDGAYEVVEAADGAEALERLRAAPRATVVVFDVIMPSMDGQQLVEQVLADPHLADRCVFVCVTASPSGRIADLPEFLAERDIPVLGKPFDIDTFLAVVAKAVGALGQKGLLEVGCRD